MLEEPVQIRPGRVKYVDLCQWTGVSREEFFGEGTLKILSVYGLIYETDELVKVLFLDDENENEENEGLVIPQSCVLEIVYYSDKTDNLKSKDTN